MLFLKKRGREGLRRTGLKFYILFLHYFLGGAQPKKNFKKKKKIKIFFFFIFHNKNKKYI